MADTKQATPEQFVLELAAIYGLDESFMRALPVPTLEMWQMLVRENAKRHKSERETMEKFRAELIALKFGVASRSDPDRTTQEQAATPDWRSWIDEIMGSLIDAAGECRILTLTDRQAVDWILWRIKQLADRGQQDAPDWTNVLESLRLDGWRVAVHNDYRQNSETFTFWLMVDSEGWTVKGEGRTDQEAFNEIAAKVIIPAKAAREGQAPKGDRIKVEREPGCKCEYAIWTNAKGCPLHDVSDPVQAQKE